MSSRINLSPKFSKKLPELYFTSYLLLSKIILAVKPPGFLINSKLYRMSYVFYCKRSFYRKSRFNRILELLIDKKGFFDVCQLKKNHQILNDPPSLSLLEPDKSSTNNVVISTTKLPFTYRHFRSLLIITHSQLSRDKL